MLYFISLFFLFLITVALISSLKVESHNQEVKVGKYAQHISRPIESEDVFLQSPDMPRPSKITQSPPSLPEGINPSFFTELNPYSRTQNGEIIADFHVSGRTDTTSATISIYEADYNAVSAIRRSNIPTTELSISNSSIGLVMTDDGLVPYYKT